MNIIAVRPDIVSTSTKGSQHGLGDVYFSLIWLRFSRPDCFPCSLQCLGPCLPLGSKTFSPPPPPAGIIHDTFSKRGTCRKLAGTGCLPISAPDAHSHSLTEAKGSFYTQHPQRLHLQEGPAFPEGICWTSPRSGYSQDLLWCENALDDVRYLRMAGSPNLNHPTKIVIGPKSEWCPFFLCALLAHPNAARPCFSLSDGAISSGGCRERTPNACAGAGGGL